MAKTFTAEELAHYDGREGRPLYISVKGVVYDCTSASDFYGPGKAYGVFAGKEVSRPLGKMMISADEANAAWDNLTPEHVQTLNEWVVKYESKYAVVGKFVPDANFAARGASFSP